MGIAAAEVTIQLPPLSGMYIQAPEIIGCNPPDVAGFVIYRQIPSDCPAQEDNLVLLPDFAISVDNNVTGVGKYPEKPGHLY